ncbi:MAG: hypothetical protein AAGD07_22550 [Planctomycetota bacterium]
MSQRTFVRFAQGRTALLTTLGIAIATSSMMSPPRASAETDPASRSSGTATTSEISRPTREAEPDLNAIRQVQLASIADREVHAEGFETFLESTELPPTSPAASEATSVDLQVMQSGFMDPNGVHVVVLKPRAKRGTYHIPKPPSGNAYDFLRDHLKRAAKADSGRIVFPKDAFIELESPPIEGLFDKGEPVYATHVMLADLEDCVVDLNGCTLKVLRQSRGITIRESKRVLLRNGTIEGSGLITSIARITPDDSPAGFRMDVLPEHQTILYEQYGDEPPPLITVGAAMKNAADQWRIAREDYSEFFANRSDLPYNHFRYVDGSYIATTAMGDNHYPFTPATTHVWLLHENNQGNAIHLDNKDELEDVTIEDVVLRNIPGMGIAGEMNRGLHIQRVRFDLPDEEPSVFAVSSDGIHINANGGDILIEDNELGPNGDDKITVKGNYWRVTELIRGLGQVIVRPVDRKTSVRRWGLKGQRLIQVDRDYNVIAKTKLAASSKKDSSKQHKLELTEVPPSLEVGSIIGNVDHAGSRVVVRNNRLIDTRAQGVLVQTSHVAVVKNHFEGIGGPAIKLNMNMNLWYEAIRTGDVLIADNTFAETCFGRTKPNDLIQFVQLNGNEQTVPIIDDVRIIGNQLVARP